jgi:hypothetical protein
MRRCALLHRVDGAVSVEVPWFEVCLTLVSRPYRLHNSYLETISLIIRLYATI